MDSKELLLYLEREKLKKEAIENSEKPIKSGSSSSKQSNQSGGVSFDTDDINVGSDDGKSSSSSTQISSTALPITSDSSGVKSEAASFKNVPEVKASDSSASVAPIKIVDDGVAKTSSSSSGKISSGSSAVTVIKNFAIVKFTGADNFGKSAYTVGKKAGERAAKAIDYFAREGAQNDAASLKRAEEHIEYMGRDSAKEASLGDEFKSGILYDKNGFELSIAQAKSFFGDDITGERRVVFSPNPNLKMSDSEFQKIINKTLSDFGEKYNKNYDFIYAVHRNTDNPHAHILMKTNDVDGEGIKMFKDELFELKMRFYENTQAVAEAKQNMFTFFYKDETHFSLAMQIGRFTGDVPGAEFAKQNIYLAEKIAKKYNLEFDEKAMQKDTDKVKQFFEANKDKYNEFTTNAKNRYADTFTKFSNDANALAVKYNLGEVPKDIEGFGEFLKQHDKLFLADKIAIDKGLLLTDKDAKNLSLNLEKDENGKLTKKGMENFVKSTEWFDKNAGSVREWNSENKDRMSKETYSRLENLNTRVDIPFAMPKDRMGAIKLTHHYKLDKTAFANDTRKALVDVVEARIKYFQKAAKSHEISKEDKKTNIERLDGLRGKIKAYDDITESSLKKYGIDTSFFSKDEKIVEMDGIKLEYGENGQKFDALLTKAIQSPEFTPEQKDKIERISHVADKQQQVSVSALENAGFKREELQKEFSIQKIETKQQIINFKRTDEFKELSNTSLKDWKQVNSNNYMLPKQKEHENTLTKEEAEAPAISDEIQQKSSYINNFRLSQAEIDSLRTMTKETLIHSDPSNVLNSLGIDFTTKQGGSNYSFRLRADDRTPSASMYLDRSGVWKFKDFGSGESGTIENVVMVATGMNYKDALNYSLDASGLKNYLAEAIESNQSMAKIQLTTEHLSRLEEIKNINIAKAQENNVNSKVLSYREITPDDTKAIEFLSNRGIDSIPKNMYIIEGQISGVGANGKEYSYTNMGVGVLTGDMSKPIELDKVGADIHFLNPKVLRDGATMKTQSFGLKDMTLIPGENDTKDYAVFESKMDYAAAACKIDLNETNVIIANGTGQANKIADLLNEQGFEKVTFFNQNDMPGEKFVSDIVEKANIEKFDFVKYEAVGEYKQDINDLVKNGVDVEQRLISNATVEDWQNYILENKEAKIEDIQSLIEKGEFKQAEQHLKDSGLDKETQAELRDDIEFAKTVSMISKAQEDTPEQEFETQQSEENQKVKDAALQEKALEDINLEKEQVRSSGMGM
ncbi:toprim domain-containing protein [Sulfurimonas sp.]|uniref:relaxase/mobilization nuclease domain-containing protein n=1 Tax=Sulfurimonas sp. TaxID=2022749 RepID=UPI002621164C|nr:toprim domain-containing protein [Sulfurimonas sp.]MDD3450946.1 toprim domain-containing protein [Sulfurimonas sp.]